MLVGGGEVAARKAQLLLSAGARLRVVAPELGSELRELCERSGAELINARFEPAHLSAAMLAVAATDDPLVNQAVSAAGRAANVWVNAVDDANASSCYLPAIVDRSPVIIAVGTGGASPTLARRVRAQLEALLPQRLGELAAFARRMRAPVRRALAGQAERRKFWDQFFDSALATRILSGATLQETAAAEFAAQLAAASAATDVASAARGAVWLIGAGPGRSRSADTACAAAAATVRCGALRPPGATRPCSSACDAMPSAYSWASGPASIAPRRRASTNCCSGMPRVACAWRASRGAIRWYSAVAARKSRRWRAPVCRCWSCRA